MICRPALLPVLLGVSLVAASQTQPKSPTARADKPAEDAQLYRNVTFGFRCKIPYGWVDRTKEMRAHAATEAPASANTPEAKEKPGTKEKAVQAAHGEVLLAVFERPPEAAGETVNSAVVIAAESAASYPGLKMADDYIGPLTELATAKGFKTAGDPSAVEIDGRELVRADFTKPLTDKLTMHQSTLILLTKGQIVSFTFIAGSEDEVNDLIGALSFGTQSDSGRL